MTSDALIIAVTLLPSARPRSRTALTVMDATRRTPLASSSTLAMASPALMPVTRAGIWLRALTFMVLLLDRSRWVHRDGGWVDGGPQLAAVVELEFVDHG